MKKFIRCVMVFAVAAMPITVFAAPITYDVDVAIGDGSVFGSLTTDITLGQLDTTATTSESGSTAAAVPEPGIIMLIYMGLIAIIAIRRHGS